MGNDCSAVRLTTIASLSSVKSGINIAILYTSHLSITNSGWSDTYVAPWRSSIATQMHLTK
jgi:hypothetical protein